MCKTHEDRLLRSETAGTNYPLTQSHISQQCRPQNERSLKCRFGGFEVLHQMFLSQNLFYLHQEVAGTTTNLCDHGYARWLAFKVLRPQTSGILTKSSSEFLNEMSAEYVFMRDSGGQGMW